MDYGESFVALIQSLKDDERLQKNLAPSTIDVLEDRPFERVCNSLERRLGHKVPREYKETYRYGNGLKIAWQITIDEEIISGEFFLKSIGVALKKMDDTQLWYEDMEEEELALYKQFQTIDVNGISADGKSAVFRIQEKKFPPEIWFIDNESTFLMGLDYKGYLDALLENRGLNGWQYFFLNDYSFLTSDDHRYEWGVSAQFCLRPEILQKSRYL